MFEYYLQTNNGLIGQHGLTVAYVIKQKPELEPATNRQLTLEVAIAPWLHTNKAIHATFHHAMVIIFLSFDKTIL
jgi:hypothetical protein